MVVKYDLTQDIASKLERLEAINWDFTSVNTLYLTHGLHPYPAKYIPQIPSTLIQELSSAGETVADIFCGSGTTLVEALLLKRNAVGIDANPLACLISEAKTTKFSEEDTKLLHALIKRASNLAASILIQREGLFSTSNPFISSAPRPLNKAISFWFEPFVIEELAEALSWCRELPTESSRKVALAAFSSIVVSVSKQDSDTRYVRREKNLLPSDVLRRFAHSLTSATHAVAEFTKIVDPHLQCKIYNTNILTKPNIDQVELVVCSPPYPNAYSYHLYHMTRMLWLEMDQPKFKNEEIGSHRKYSRKGSNGATTETFRSEMAIIFDWLSNHLRANRFACFVIGDSTINGQEVRNADLISDIAREKGFLVTACISRRMQDTKKAFNPIIGKIKSEQILLLQNKNGKLL
jgi:DNA modification methylase